MTQTLAEVKRRRTNIEPRHRCERGIYNGTSHITSTTTRFKTCSLKSAARTFRCSPDDAGLPSCLVSGNLSYSALPPRPVTEAVALDEFWLPHTLATNNHHCKQFGGTSRKKEFRLLERCCPRMGPSWRIKSQPAPYPRWPWPPDFLLAPWVQVTAAQFARVTARTKLTPAPFIFDMPASNTTPPRQKPGIELAKGKLGERLAA